MKPLITIRRIKREALKSIKALPKRVFGRIKKLLRKKIGVVINLKNIQFANEISHHLCNIPSIYKLLVHVDDNISLTDIKRLFTNKNYNAESVIVKHFKSNTAYYYNILNMFSSIINKCDIFLYITTPDDNIQSVEYWRTLLLNMIGSSRTVNSVIENFKQKNIGIIYPGKTNINNHAIGVPGAYCNPGDKESYQENHNITLGNFWIRVDACNLMFSKALFSKLTVQDSCDFFSSVCHDQGFVSIESYRYPDYLNTSSFYLKRPYRIRFAAEIVKNVDRYKQLKNKNTIVVYTAIIGDYDSILIPEVIDPDIDYVCFSDRPRDGFGVFSIWPVDYHNADPVKIARYIKTHPHKYFPEYDVSIWVDGNVLIRGDLKKYIDKIKSAGMSFGAVTHPRRNCLYDEADSCKEMNKDDAEIIDSQVARYRHLCIQPETGLIETNFFITFHHDPAVQNALTLWWSEIERFSRRDQLSVMYALNKTGLGWYSLLEDNYSIRNHYDFALFRHGKENMPEIDGDLSSISRIQDPYQAKASSDEQKRRLKMISSVTIDIIICVHNAFDDVIACLDSVYESLQTGHSIIIIDDCSDHPVESYLIDFAEKDSRIKLIRNDRPLGYTKSANIGLNNSTAQFIILLNSDTIVPAGWSHKLAEAAYSNPIAGIVGPLSNAASHQSIPQIKGTNNQTAINPLPQGMGVADVDRYCEQWSLPGLYPSVPLVHGFCLGIRREVVEKIGCFDEAAFPNGYGEENDYCFRASDAGFDLLIATNTFVFHSKSKSYQDDRRIELMKAGRAALGQKHGEDRIKSSILNFQNHPLLVQIRDKSKLIY